MRCSVITVITVIVVITVIFKFLSDMVIFSVPNDNVFFKLFLSVFGDNGIFDVFSEKILCRVVIDRFTFRVLNDRVHFCPRNGLRYEPEAI